MPRRNEHGDRNRVQHYKTIRSGLNLGRLRQDLGAGEGIVPLEEYLNQEPSPAEPVHEEPIPPEATPAETEYTPAPQPPEHEPSARDERQPLFNIARFVGPLTMAKAEQFKERSGSLADNLNSMAGGDYFAAIDPKRWAAELLGLTTVGQILARNKLDTSTLKMGLRRLLPITENKCPGTEVAGHIIERVVRPRRMPRIRLAAQLYYDSAPSEISKIRQHIGCFDFDAPAPDLPQLPLVKVSPGLSCLPDYEAALDTAATAFPEGTVIPLRNINFFDMMMNPLFPLGPHPPRTR